MKRQFKYVLALAAVFTLVACGKGQSDGLTTESVLDETETSVEAATTVISGVADDQANSSLAMGMSASKQNLWNLLFIDEAYAAACSRAYASTCSAGIKSVDYNSCDVAGTLRSLAGSVTLTYSNNSCLLSQNGDSVTRTYDVQITGARNGVFSLSSATQSDYNGASYGGGGKITKTASGWDLEVLGRHSRLDRNGRNLLNISTRTLSPLSISGSISRSSRVVTGGQLEVNHNLAGFTAVFSPSNLAWTANCCHPVSGSMNITYSGSRTGTASLQFNGCGSATVTHNGASQQVSLTYCE